MPLGRRTVLSIRQSRQTSLAPPPGPAKLGGVRSIVMHVWAESFQRDQQSTLLTPLVLPIDLDANAPILR